MEREELEREKLERKAVKKGELEKGELFIKETVTQLALQFTVRLVRLLRYALFSLNTET